MTIAILGGGGGGGAAALDITDVDGLLAALALKADLSLAKQLEGELSSKAALDHTHDERYPLRAELPELVEARLALQKGVLSGLATLDGSGKLPTSQLPALAISEVYFAASEAELLTLSTQTGDVVVVSGGDFPRTWLRTGSATGTLADFVELTGAAAGVVSVNEQVGIVRLTTSEVPEGSNQYYSPQRVQGLLEALLGKPLGLAPLDAEGKLPLAHLPSPFPAGGVPGQVLGLGVEGNLRWTVGSRAVLDIPITGTGATYRFFPTSMGVEALRLVALDKNTGLPVSLLSEVTVRLADGATGVELGQIQTSGRRLVELATGLRIAEGQTLILHNDNQITGYSEGLKTGTVVGLESLGPGKLLALVSGSGLRRSDNGALSFGPLLPGVVSTSHFRLKTVAGEPLVVTAAGVQRLDPVSGEPQAEWYRSIPLAPNPGQRVGFTALKGETYVRYNGGLYRYEASTGKVLNLGISCVAGPVLYQDMIYLARGSGGVSKSAKGDTGYQSSITGLPPGHSVAAIEATPFGLFCASTNQGVFRLEGTAWQDASAGLLNLLITYLYYDGLRLLAATDGLGVWAYDTAAQRWAPDNAGLNHYTVRDLRRHGDHLYCATNGGVYRREPLGWTLLGTGLSSSQSVVTLGSDGTSLLACTTGGTTTTGTLFALRASGVWESIGTDLGLSTFSISANALGAENLAEGLWVTTHQGVQLRAKGETTWRIFPFAVYDVELLEGRLYLLSSTGLLTYDPQDRSVRRLLSTHDWVGAVTNGFPRLGLALGGRYWVVGTGFGLRSVDVGAQGLDPRNHSGNLGSFTATTFVAFEGQLWVGGGGALLQRYELVSGAWQSVNAGLPPGKTVRVLYPWQGTLLAGVENAGCFVWQADLERWEPRSNGLTNVEVNVFAHDERLLYAAALNGGVFVSADGGNSWNPLPELHLYLLGNLV